LLQAHQGGGSVLNLSATSDGEEKLRIRRRKKNIPELYEVMFRPPGADCSRRIWILNLRSGHLKLLGFR
jgi:hypothetical protein